MKSNLPKYISAIYIIRNNINDKIYIGSAIDVKARWVTHRSRLKNNQHHSIILQRAYNKYGIESLSYEILEYVTDKNKLIEREQVWINFFKPEYNINKIAGNNLGMKHSEETKKKMSEAHKGYKRCLGKKASEETKEKMSLKKRGGLNHTARKVKIDNIVYGSITEAAKAYNVHFDTIKNRIKTKNNYEYVN
jgi:group I intron endonuclease